MLICIKHNEYVFLKRKEFTSDKEYYTEILKLKYKTLLKKNVPTKQKMIKLKNIVHIAAIIVKKFPHPSILLVISMQ